MAERAVRALTKLEDQLNCSICLDTYTDPKFLQCHHVFCERCLDRLVIQLTLTCPTCRQVTPVPANGVAGLQPAFRINHLLEIVNDCKKPMSCPEHGDKQVELYCATCEELICWKCIMRTGRHHSHDYEELNTAFKKYKEEVTLSLEPIKKQTVAITEALAQIDIRHQEISNQQVAVEADINDTFRQLCEVINDRKMKLINQLHDITQKKLRDLEVQKEQFTISQVQLNDFLDFMKESFNSSSEEDMLVAKTTVVKEVNEIITALQPPTLTHTEADVIFSVSSIDLAGICKNYGQVTPQDLVNRTAVQEAVVMETSTANLQLEKINFSDELYEQSEKSLKCELVSELTGTQKEGSVIKRGQSQYEIMYQPTIKGMHQLHIKVEDQHIRGSPFSITATLPISKLGNPILAIDDVKGPHGVAINNKREVVIVESRGYCVSIFSPRGEKIRSFGTRGSNHGEFRYPKGVAVDCEGNILVTDCKKNCVQKFTKEGIFLDSEGSGSLHLYYPSGIAVSTKSNKVYVADETDRIYILNRDLTFSSTFGHKGSDKGQFYNPQGIAFDSSGNLYVADCGNNRIQVFTADGKFLRTFGRHGEDRGELRGPTDVAVDSDDIVYISEATNNRVSVFTSYGQFVTSFGRQGIEPGEFMTVNSLAVDSSGVLYVCDSTRSVQLF